MSAAQALGIAALLSPNGGTVLSSSIAAQRLRPSAPAGAALTPGGRLRQASGTATVGHVSVGGNCLMQRSFALRVVPSSEVVSSPPAAPGAAYHVAAAPRSATGPPAASSNGGSDYGSSSSSSSLNGSALPPLHQRSSATTSELLRAVLKRRAERLQRQQDAGTSSFLAASPPQEQQQQQQEASPVPVQQQQQQQAGPPPRYPPHWSKPGTNGCGPVNGAASHFNGAASSMNGTARAAPPSSLYNGAAMAPPPQPQSASLQPVAAPEQRIVRQNAADLVREDAVAQRKLATVRFWLKFRAEWGQRIKVVGTHQELGAWILSTAPELKWSQGDNWHTTVQLPAGGVVEYKYVLLDHSGNHPVAWQQGNNSVLALRPDDELVEVFDNWGADPGAKLVADGGQPVTRENRLLSWASEMEAQLVSQKQDLRRSRMELAAAHEEAREARNEAQRFKAQFQAMEAERVEAANHLLKARALNEALQSQLADTTASFHEALRTAADILNQIDEVSAADAAVAAAAMPPPPAMINVCTSELAAMAAELEKEEEAAPAVPEVEATTAAVVAEPGVAPGPEPAAAPASEEAVAAAVEEEHTELDEEAAISRLEPPAAVEPEPPAGVAAPVARGAKGEMPFVASTKRRRRAKGIKTKSSRK